MKRNKERENFARMLDDMVGPNQTSKQYRAANRRSDLLRKKQGQHLARKRSA